MLETIKKQIEDSCRVKQNLLADGQQLKAIESAAAHCVSALKQGNKIMLAGNGGSAADAQHLAAELVGRFETERLALPALALPTNSSTMTSIANDYDYDSVYRRQIQGLGNAGDVFIGLSTSGNSPNVLAAIDECRKHGIIAIGLTGESGGAMRDLCDVCIRVPSKNTARIQETHIVIGHVICSLVDQAFPTL